MDEWLTTAEAAGILGVRPVQLYRLIDEGRLPAYAYGRRLRLLRLEVELFRDLGEPPTGHGQR